MQDVKQDFRSRLLKELREAVYGTASLHVLADLMGQQLKWKGGQSAALSYCSHMLAGRKHFPASCIPLVFVATGKDVVTPLLQMEQLRIQLEKNAQQQGA